MVIIINANGDVVKNIPENIYQGSNNANSIVVLAPFASSSQLTIAYRLPDGVLTEPALMTPYEDVPSEYDLSGWYINLDEAITEKYGNVDFQVRATTNSDTVVASFGFNFTVLRGVAPILPPTPSQSIYEQILTALASIQADIVNGWLESKGLLPYDETFTYSLNTVLYSNNTFYKSKIPDNVGNPLTDTNSWEEILFATEQEVADLIQAHNISETAHNDIRLILAGLIDGTYPIDSCANVSETINDINITDIFESNGITAKSATNAKNDALGNDIAGTYSKILDIINNVNSTDIDKPLSANQGKVLQEQITALSGSLVPQGNWDASTNTPNISETTTTGHYWIVSVAGTTDFGGITDWQVNDWIVKTSTSWAKIDNSDNTKMEKITSNYIYVDTETMIADELNIQEGQIVKGGEIYYVYLGTTNSSISDFGMIGGGDNWINYASESFESGTGIELDPYIITSPEQLAYLSKLVNSGLNQSGVYFKLNNNIDLSKKQWTPIGYLTVDFSGTFLGNNKIINGLTNISTSFRGMGLFGSNAGTIKDLELRNTFICGYQYVGGIVGFNSGVISNCINNGVVMAFYECGGIAGKTLNTIEYCINYSTLIGNNDGNGDFGGIAGSAGNHIYVKHCVNFGDILGTESYVGGIVGSLSGGHIYYSYNLGNIFGNDRVGGIVGVIWGTNPSSSIFECYNIGRVKGLTNVGGVYGINAGNSYSSYYLENIIEGENDSTGLNKTLTEIRNLVADGILDNTYWEDDVNITGMLTPALKSINYNLQNNSKYITGRAIQENINNIEFDLAEIKSKLSGIEDGAEVNVIETVKVNDVALTPTEKTVSFTVPTQASDIDALPDTTKYGATVDLTYTALSGELEVTLKDQDGNTLNSKKVDLPLELIITSGTVETCTVIDTPVAGYVVGDKYLDLVLANGGHIYVLVSDLVDQITITETGTGNAVTDISINGSVITETKGKTFVETNRTVAGKELSDDITIASSDLTDSANLIKGATIYGGTISDNFDTITKNGFYTGYGTATGAPNTTYSWFLLHENSNVGTVSATQKAVAYSATPEMYVRVKMTTWGAWKKVALIDDIPVLIAETATLPYTSWTGASAPFTKAVTVSGVLATDLLDIDLDLSSSTYGDVATIQNDWANIYRAVVSADTITFYASEVPTIDIPLQIKGVR